MFQNKKRGKVLAAVFLFIILLFFLLGAGAGLARCEDPLCAKITVPSFDRGFAQKFLRFSIGASLVGCERWIFDLRNCTGGQDSEALRTAWMFLPEDATVVFESIKNKSGFSAVNADSFQFEEEDIDFQIDGQVIILVSRQTSGAGELFAASLQDNHRAVIIGEKTAGDKSLMKYFSPLTRRCLLGGIEPDIKADVSNGKEIFELARSFLAGTKI
ncbi:MAG: S41 family peptidase [Candidatus Pacebacteria bacterium]|nr:S41 family peptidase [Candidatus Paceibacterota bacterium]